MANMMALITNTARSIHGKKGIKMTEFTDFMPIFDPEQEKEPKKQSVDEMKNFMLAFARRHNKQIELKELKKRKTPPVSKRKETKK